MNLQQNCAIPVLPSRDLAETIEFYQKLGFEVAAEYEDYAILCRELIEIHFFRLSEIVPDQSYAGCYLRVPNVDELFHEFTVLSLPTEGIPRIGKLEDKPWGMREFYIIDFSGNLLKIGQPLSKNL